MLDLIFQNPEFYTTNFILAADSYKVGHANHLKPGTEKTHSNIVPRKALGISGKTYNEIVTLGPQIVAKILSKVVITDAMIDEAEVEITQAGYAFPREQWEYIRDLGYLPLEVRALPEGFISKPGLPVMTIENTDSKSPWLPSYVETWAQDIVWTMTTTATVCRQLKIDVEAFCETTGAAKEAAEYMVHNFGDRGAGGQDRAIMAAIAHGVFFSGSDCLRANRYIKRYYNTALPYLSSVDATEHSTICANSDLATMNDYGAFVMSLRNLERAVDNADDGIGIPLVSTLIDTYDDERFVKEFVLGNYDKICEIGGKYVLRPDSGDAVKKPIEVVNWLIEGLYTNAGLPIPFNEEGYALLPENLGVLQGDGLRLPDFTKIFDLAIRERICASAFAFGFGGGLTNGFGRDDFSFSMKATATFVDGKWIDMQKVPKTDTGKTSLKGRVTVIKVGDELQVAPSGQYACTEVMKTIFKNGEVEDVTFEAVRCRARG